MAQPVKINQEFECQQCGHLVPPADRTCRNHCTKCLYSLHVDQTVPGDRASTCHGLMEPIAIEYSGKKGYQIIHRCIKCQHQQINKSAQDDDLEAILQIMHKSQLS